MSDKIAPIVIAAALGSGSPAALGQGTQTTSDFADNAKAVCETVEKNIFPLLKSVNPEIHQAIGVMQKDMTVLPAREEGGGTLPPTCRYEFNLNAGQQPINGIKRMTFDVSPDPKKGTIAVDVDNPNSTQKGEKFEFDYQRKEFQKKDDTPGFKNYLEQTGWSLKL